MIRRIFATILIAAMLASFFCFVPVISAASDQALIEQYQIPDNWARNALLFAVKNGLLSGKGTGGLSPYDNATRAETATILTNILKTQTLADLSGFTDVSKSAWYYAPVARAVSLNILSGDGNGKLLPNANITREQACCVLASAFGVYGGSELDLTPFSDAAKVSGWAASAMSSMVHRGCIAGTDGKLNPQARITRQELAQILYRLISGLGTTVPKEVQGNYVLSATTVPDGTLVQGDLTLCTDAETIELNDVSVTGRLVIQGCGDKTIYLKNCNIQCLTLCAKAEVFSDSKLSEAEIARSAVFHPDATLVTLFGKGLTVCEESTVDSLHICADASNVSVNGTVTTAAAQRDNLVLNGNGTVQALDVFGNHCEAACQIDIQTGPGGINPEYIQLSAETTLVPTELDPTGEMRVSFSGSALEQPLANCRLYLFVNGTLTHETGLFDCASTFSPTFQYNFSRFMAAYIENVPVVAVLCTQKGQYCTQLAVDTSAMLRQEALKVRTSYAYAKVLRDTGLYYDYDDVSDRLSILLGTIPAGTVVVFNRTYLNAARITIEDGKTGWVIPKDIEIIGELEYTTSDYTTPVKEYYVNRIGNYASQSKYLIWVNIWCQQINIFEGTQGNWHLIRTADCATGDVMTPSPQSIRKIVKKSEQTVYPGVYYYHHVTWTEGDICLHSRLYAPNGSFYDPTIGRPVSNGCIRLYDEDCIWIYDNAPIGTTVVIY